MRIMASRSWIFVWSVGALAVALLGAAPASAEERIGNTALARNQVSQVSAAKTAPINQGDDVFADENVKTGQDSSARFVFSDQTNLAIGPISTVKLDRFVFKGDTSYAKAAVNFTAGAFRFTTGGSDKGAYQLKTSTATIGVRGTVFDVRIEGGVTTLTLVEGAIAVCPRSKYDGDPRKLSKAQLKRFNCQELDKPGQTARVTSRSASLSNTPFSFAENFCSGGGGLCAVSTAAALNENTPSLCYVNQD